MMPTTHAQLSVEDLTRYQLAQLPIEGLTVNPDKYSRQETEQAVMGLWLMEREIFDRYGVDVTRPHSIDIRTGLIWYYEDD